MAERGLDGISWIGVAIAGTEQRPTRFHLANFDLWDRRRHCCKSMGDKTWREIQRYLVGIFACRVWVGPFAVLGAFGSPTDAILSLLAGLSFGWLAALLMESTTENRFLDAFGIAAVLALVGSAIGYDGAQLILLAVLPSFAFAIAALMPSRTSAAILTGLWRLQL